MKPDFPFQRLPGTYRGLFGKASLWEGPDHILSVTGSRFSEEYRRFYYRDVQAIIVQKAPRAGSIGVLALLAVGVMVGILTLQSVSRPEAVWFLTVMLLLSAMRVYVCLGASCRCSIRTAVSCEPLPSLLRTWSARKTTARIAMLVRNVQGELSEDSILAAADPEAEDLLPPLPSSQPASSTRVKSGMRLALMAFVVLLVNAGFAWVILSGIRFRGYSWLEPTLRFSFLLSEMLLVITALIRIRGAVALKFTRQALIAAIVLVGIRAYVSNLSSSFTMIFQTMRVSSTMFWTRTGWVIGSAEVSVAVIGLGLVLLNWDICRETSL